MKALLIIYIINACFLLLHEMESAYFKEWEIIKLPGRIAGFLLLHIPIIIVLFWGAIELYKQTWLGMWIALIGGIGGLLPFAVHEVIVKKKDYFNLTISRIIIYSNLLTGVITIAGSIYLLGKF